MKEPRRIALRCGFLALAVGLSLWLTACAPAPSVQPGPAAPPEPPAPPAGFKLKSHQRSMRDGMRACYERAGEVFLGVLEAVRRDGASGATYIFSDVVRFDKATLSWEPPLDLFLEVKPGALKPEIIARDEYQGLLALDKVGICWEPDGGGHSVFLVEGRKNLVFVEVGYDDAAARSFRNLLDAYPETPECRAADVFLMMLRDLYSERR